MLIVYLSHPVSKEDMHTHTLFLLLLVALAMWSIA